MDCLCSGTNLWPTLPEQGSSFVLVFVCNVYVIHCAACVQFCNIHLQQTNSSINSQTICGRRTLLVNSCSCLSTFMCALCTMHYHVFVPIEGKTIAKHSICMYFYNNITCGVIIALDFRQQNFRKFRWKMKLNEMVRVDFFISKNSIQKELFGSYWLI